jgi:hypothetical protein
VGGLNYRCGAPVASAKVLAGPILELRLHRSTSGEFSTSLIMATEVALETTLVISISVSPPNTLLIGQ